MAKPHETLEKVALFRSLERKDREAFEHRCQWRHAHPKEWLLEQNDIGTDIYFLTSGVVRVLITPSPDREIILGDIEAGGYFGEMAAIDGQPRSAGILAITDATIARMPATVFREIIHQYPDVSEQLLRQLVARIRTLDQRVNEFSSMHVKNRIYAELLRRSRPDPTDKRQAVVSPPPVHSDIAARVSTRREMVARELKALERAGLLTKRRGAFVLNNVPRADAHAGRKRLTRRCAALGGRPGRNRPGAGRYFTVLMATSASLAAPALANSETPSARAAEGREGGREPDLKRSRTVIVGAAFADVMMLTVLLADIWRADDGKEFGRVLLRLAGHDDLPLLSEGGPALSSVEVRNVTAQKIQRKFNSLQTPGGA